MNDVPASIGCISFGGKISPECTPFEVGMHAPSTTPTPATIHVPSFAIPATLLARWFRMGSRLFEVVPKCNAKLRVVFR
jgi:hypothetical protein